MVGASPSTVGWPERLRSQVDGLPPGRTFLAVVVLLLAVYVPTASYDYRVSIDAAMTALPAWNLVEHGSLDLTPYEPELRARGLATQHLTEGSDGQYSDRTAGVVLWGTLFYGLASPVVSGSMPFPMWPAALAGAVASALAMGVLHLALRRVVSPFEAVLAAVVVGIGTGTWSVSADALWPHGPTQLWLALGLWASANARFLRAGGAFGLALLTRPYHALTAAVMGLGAGITRRSVWPVVAVGAGAVVGLAALLGWNDMLFGGASVSGGYAERSYVQTAGDPTSRDLLAVGRNLLGAFVDPQRGMLWYSPFLVALLPGVAAAWRRAEGWMRSAAVSAVMVLLAQYWVQPSQGGDLFFGSRYGIEPLTLAAPLLVLAWREWVAIAPGRRRAFRILVVVSVALQAFGAIFDPHTWG